MSERDLQAVTDYLHAQIPMTAQMGIRVMAYDGQSVRLHAPLAPNVNHRKTAFGGSLATMGILAGWTLLHLRLGELNLAMELVIQKSEVDYKRPVYGDFEAVCVYTGDAIWRRFTRMIADRGKGRLALTSEIYSDGQLVATHHGLFVALGARFSGR